MTLQRARRLVKPVLYTTSATLVAGGLLYWTQRPRSLPGSQAAAVPPPAAHEAGSRVRPATFPALKSREEQIADLKLRGRFSAVAATDEVAPAAAADDDGYDLLVIGGGATGSGIALDAATRGLRVALVEREDFGSETSSKSTKLVHGGVRYLEKAFWDLDHNQYKLVVEALRERKYFLHTAPHLSTWLPIMLPIDRWWKAPYYWAGTKLYDVLAGSENIESSYFLTRSKALEAFPMLKTENLVGALVYYDGAHNDSRMNVSLALTAAWYGATVVNHMEVTGLEKDEAGALTGARMRDLIPGKNGKTAEEFSVRAKVVVNATGPFTDSIRHMDEPGARPIVAPSSGVHVVLPDYFSPGNMGLIDPSTSDGRVIFLLPWQGNTLVGTTDDGAPAITRNPIAHQREIDWILAEVRTHLSPEIRVRRRDVLAAWSGIRPLVRDPKVKNTASVVRSHLVDVSGSGLLTCAGGKWTTYRQMAEDTVDEAIRVFGLQTRPIAPPPFVRGETPADRRGRGRTDVDHVVDDAPLHGDCQTHRVRLIGAHGYSRTLYIQLRQHVDGLETGVARHLADAYGDQAWTVVAAAAAAAATDDRIAPAYPFLAAEIVHGVRHEYAQTAIDVLARRTRLAFLDVHAALDALPRVIDVMAAELAWSPRRAHTEWLDGVRFLQGMGLPPACWGVSRAEVEQRRGRRRQVEEEGEEDEEDEEDEEVPVTPDAVWRKHSPVLPKESPANR
ncbi:MAG: mitochondrial glycerol-3-phosphate dehydrogenase [Phylliscum demangeonii]|nr:MAG: mitochondrial glycerol-3-phosphate dehydrogenase [Phylliscum demangeonii]